MATIPDYLDWRGDLPFSVSPFNEVDAYLCAKLADPDAAGILPERGFVPLSAMEEVCRRFLREEKLGALGSRLLLPVLHRLPQTPRFQPLRLGDYVRKAGKEEQFSALTAEMEDGSTFRFEYVYTYSPGQTGNGSGETGTAAPSPGLFPVRGLTAVFLFITGLYSAVTAAEDSRRGLFTPLPVRLRLPCRFASLAAPVALAALSGLSAVLLSGGPGISSGGAAAILPEAAAMALYALAVSIFSMALGAILKTPEALGAAIPFFIIGSLVFCPVFFDAERLLSALLLPPRLLPLALKTSGTARAYKTESSNFLRSEAL